MASSSRSPFLWPAVTIAVGLVVALIALPDSYKTALPAFLRAPAYHLGLDLAGGTQLDFRISEQEIAQQLADTDKKIAELEANGGSTEEINALLADKQAIQLQSDNLVEAIRNVLERRINSLGVSEATITPSYFGGEKHLLVECPGIVDVQKCIATVGKTIQLEFKEEFTQATAEYEQGIRATVAEAKGKLAGKTLQGLGQDYSTQLGVVYNDANAFFKDQLPKGMEDVWDMKPSTNVLERTVTVPTTKLDEQGRQVPATARGVMLVQVLSPRTQTGRVIQEASVAFKTLQSSDPTLSYQLHEQQELGGTMSPTLAGTLRGMQPGELRTVAGTDNSAQVLFLRLLTPGREEAEVSHILVSFKGASQAEPSVTRTKEEALKRAQELKQQLTGGAQFDVLARSASDGPSKQSGGRIGVVTKNAGLVPAYEQYAFTAKAGDVSDPIESPFGYFLVRVDKAAHTTPDRVNYDALTVKGDNALTRAQDIVTRMQKGEVKQTQEVISLRTLFFSLEPTGWKDTALDGKHFRTASVILDPTTNRPQVQITFDAEGGKLFQEMTKANVGKRIAIFVGGELVSDPVVQGEIIGGTAVITGSADVAVAQKLAQDLNTGAIPAPIYLSGQRTVEATLGQEALATSVRAALYGLVVLILFLIMMYRFLGVLAMIGLSVYIIIFIALLKLPLFLVTDQYIVLTLAGVAGMILSIGLAIDTNVLVFERMKEELRKGKMLKTAVEVGFHRAWPSIRDSNISTLITCALLFLIGTSIVRGFAVTLGLGVIISMFTGMVVSRWIARRMALTPLANTPSLFPGMRRDA